METFDTIKELTKSSSLTILEATAQQPMTAKAISIKYGIPIAVCYRYVKDLCAKGFLERDDNSKRRNHKFRSKVDGFDLRVRGNKITFILGIKGEWEKVEIDARELEVKGK